MESLQTSGLGYVLVAVAKVCVPPLPRSMAVVQTLRFNLSWK